VDVIYLLLILALFGLSYALIPICKSIGATRDEVNK
jgi:hypothetical protein